MDGEHASVQIYNISVPLLVGWLKEMENFTSLTLMFQKEVADRIMAPVGSKDYAIRPINVK